MAVGEPPDVKADEDQTAQAEALSRIIQWTDLWSVSFNSLFIGIGSAILAKMPSFWAVTYCFNSLFIGIGSAIFGCY